MKKFYTSIPVLVLFFLLLRDYLSCGVLDTMMLFVLSICCWIYLAAHFLYSVVIYFFTKEGFNLRPLITAVILFLVGYCYFSFDSFSKKSILHAKKFEPSSIVNLDLYENKRLEFHYGNIHRICKCEGTYIKNNDTLLIEGVNAPEKYKMSNKYLIRDKYVIPIRENGIEKDSTQYLEIKK